MNADSTDAEANTDREAIQDYDTLVDEYSIYLNLYEQCQLGSLSIESIDISQYPRLQEKFNEVIDTYDTARAEYYDVYNNYVKRLEYLLQQEEGDA